MKHLWLNKKNNKNLIIFFNGWAMNQSAISHLDYKNYDLIMFYDYRTLDCENFDFSQYENKYFIGWSMGVFIANFIEFSKNIKTKIAINGTLAPINDKFGIPKKIYDLTANNLNETSCQKFIQKMDLYKEFKFVPDRTILDLKDELLKIKQYTKSFSQLIYFDKVIISNKDKIIPFKNQLNFWQNQNNVIIKQIDTGHYPFGFFSNWEDIINA